MDDEPATMTRSVLLPASQETREWCSILEQEMMRWPGVKVSHMFGTLAFYHRKVMFAMLPEKRSLDGSTAISFRGAETDWQTFQLVHGDLVGTALSFLGQAYQDSVSHPFSELRTSARIEG
jgi:hypothetical protein